MENTDTSMEAFFEAFDGTDGNQTDTEEVTMEDRPAESVANGTASEGEESPGSAETAEEENGKEADKDGTEETSEPESNDPEQKFVVKVNKETREVSYQDAPAWIQKGMDYDRVKEQLDTTRQNEQALQDKLTQQGEIIETLELISQAVNVPIPDLLEQLHINAVKGTGKTDEEAKAIVRADKLERQLKVQTAKQEKAQSNSRVERELQEFRAAFPEVKLDEALAEKLAPDIRAGMSLTSAYLKAENQRLQAEMQQQQQKEAAAAKNKENRKKAPGSQLDSGGQRTKTAEDDFFAAFEK